MVDSDSQSHNASQEENISSLKGEVQSVPSQPIDQDQNASSQKSEVQSLQFVDDDNPFNMIVVLDGTVIEASSRDDAEK